jgi:hypothetical protein
MKPRALLSTTILLVLAGCGTPGAPQPPSLHLPRTVDDLRAERIGDKVYLSWTAPAETTDNEGIKSVGKVEICRALQTPALATCRDKAGEVALPVTNEQADRHQTFVDDISSLMNGPQDFLTYNVIATNARGKAAGTSNPVAIFTAPSAPTAINLRAASTREAVVLNWELPAAPPTGRLNAQYFVRVVRKAGDAEASILNESPWGLNEFRDGNFVWEQPYTYTVLGVTRVLSRDGSKTLAEFTGEASSPVTITPHDVFPPATPEAVQAVYSAGFIDLTWRALAETDIAGYNVYRTYPGVAPQKLNTQPIAASAFRDGQLQGIAPGTELTYFVTTVDQYGNESAKSQPATETIPKP